MQDIVHDCRICSRVGEHDDLIWDAKSLSMSAAWNA